MSIMLWWERFTALAPSRAKCTLQDIIAHMNNIGRMMISTENLERNPALFLAAAGPVYSCSDHKILYEGKVILRL